MGDDVAGLAAEELCVELRELPGQGNAFLTGGAVVERLDVPVEELPVSFAQGRRFVAECREGLLRGASREGELRFPLPRVAARHDLRAVEQHFEGDLRAACGAVIGVEVDDAPAAARRGEFALQAEAPSGDGRAVDRLGPPGIHGVEHHALALPDLGHLAQQLVPPLRAAGRGKERCRQRQERPITVDIPIQECFHACRYSVVFISAFRGT